MQSHKNNQQVSPNSLNSHSEPSPNTYPDLPQLSPNIRDSRKTIPSPAPVLHKKRNRLCLSCNYCKKRKVKCDRGRPCSSCMKYNVPDLCEYTVTEIKTSVKSRKVSTEPAKPKEVNPPLPFGVLTELELLKGRIHEIENSVRPIGGGGDNFTGTVAGSIPSTVPSTIPGSNITPHAVQLNPLQSQNIEPHPQANGNGTPLNGTPLNGTPLNGLPSINWSPSVTPVTPQPSTEDMLKFDGTFPDVNDYARERLKYTLGNNPCTSRDQIINFHTEHPSLPADSPIYDLKSGVFSWMAYLRKDPTLGQIYCYLNGGNSEVLHANLIRPSISATQTHADKIAEEGFRQKAMKSDGSMDTVPYTALHEKFTPTAAGIHIVNSTANASDSPESHNQDTLALGLTVKKDALNAELQLAEQILTILPNRKVIWILMSKFFVYVYPFVPFVDETTFRAELARIIGPEQYIDAKIDHLNVEKRLDFAHLGIMLIMLRIAYLFLFSNRPEVNEFNLNNTDETSDALSLRYLLSNPIPIQVVEVAQVCLNKFDLMRMTELPVLQLLYALRYYHVHGPEEGDNVEGGTDQISNALIVHVAYTQGLHRDPNKMLNGKKDEKLNNLTRKLWFFIMVSDLMQGHQFGNQMALNSEYFNTKLPFYVPGNENLLDTDLEQFTISVFSYFNKYGHQMRRLLNLELNINGCNVGELVDGLSEVEGRLYDTFGSLGDYMTPFVNDDFEYPFMKILKCKLYLNANNFLLSNYLHLYCHFREQGDVKLSLFYYKKLIVNTALNMMPYYFDLFGLNHVNFGIGADMMLNPSFISLIHKSTQVNLSMWSLINTVIHSLKNSARHSKDLESPNYSARFKKCCQLSYSLHTVCKFGVLTMSKLSNRYYYAWRISKVYNFLVRFLSKNELYSHISPLEALTFYHQISDYDLDDLCALYELSIVRITERKKSYDSAEPVMHFPPCKRKSQSTEAVTDVPDTGSWWPYTDAKEMEFDFTPTNDSDMMFMDLTDNKDIDKFWVQLTGEVKNQELSNIDYESVFDDMFS